MAGRHFLSVLGTSNYSSVTYRCEEGAVATEYIQEAVLKLKMLNERGFEEGDQERRGSGRAGGFGGGTGLRYSESGDIGRFYC